MTLPASEVLQGTLDLLILKTLTLQPMHGWGIRGPSELEVIYCH